MKRAVLSVLVAVVMSSYGMAAGHGPLFGLATPTNSQGEYSFDFGAFGRSSGAGSQASARALIGYGFTPHLTLSFTAPLVVGNATLPPTRIQPRDDFESTFAWRFQHNATTVGTRFESTAFAGVVVPGAQSAFNGVAHTTNVPGSMVGVVTGMASRSHYLWLGTPSRSSMNTMGTAGPTCSITLLFTAIVRRHGANRSRSNLGFWRCCPLFRKSRQKR